ncbi:hypothetical protein [Sulfurimonas sp. NWX367]|uniref:hypothetical protein n=1 Tax=Sulfurimonas sp. NWX367 TaxID=2925413 RepID=UPI003204C30D
MKETAVGTTEKNLVFFTSHALALESTDSDSFFGTRTSVRARMAGTFQQSALQKKIWFFSQVTL